MDGMKWAMDGIEQATYGVEQVMERVSDETEWAMDGIEWMMNGTEQVTDGTEQAMEWSWQDGASDGWHRASEQCDGASMDWMEQAMDRTEQGDGAIGTTTI